MAGVVYLRFKQALEDISAYSSHIHFILCNKLETKHNFFIQNGNIYEENLIKNKISGQEI